MMVEEKLIKIADEHPYPLLFATISGAHLYGFPSADSDYDLRGVHVLPLPEVLGMKETRETVEVEEIRDGLELDLVTHDVRKFFTLMLKNNGYVLEQLFSPLVVKSTPEFDELKEVGKRCITVFHAHHYFGFARTEMKLFEKEAPHRVKPLLYIFRVLLTGIHLMQTGEVEANLSILNSKFNLSYIPELIHRKVNGKEKETIDGDIEFYKSEYERLVKLLEDEKERSSLRTETDARDDMNDLLVRVRMEYGQSGQ